jgi:NitT/TauT family transport system substrate-binding protein
MQAKNQAIEAFVLQGRAPQIVLAVSTKTMPDFKTIADLKGKKIGVTAPGSSTAMMVSYVLAKAGLKPTDVSFVGVGASAGALTAIKSGQIDAIANLDPVITMLQRDKLIKIVADTRTLKDTQSVYGGPMPAAVLYTQARFIAENPNTTQALANAMVHALRWLQKAGPSEIVKTVPESYLLGDRALYLAAWENVRQAMSPDGVMPEAGPATALRMLESFEPSLKGKKIDLAKTYTNAFARKAAARYA